MTYEHMIYAAIDFVQEHLLGEGQQRNESAVEQMKDKEIRHGIESLI